MKLKEYDDRITEIIGAVHSLARTAGTDALQIVAHIRINIEENRHDCGPEQDGPEYGGADHANQ